MCRRTAILFAGCLVFCSGSRAIAEDSGDLTSRTQDLGAIEAAIKTQAIIGFSWIDQPLNRIVVIRSGPERCAIVYRSFRRAHDAKPETAFNSGQESFFGEADFFVMNSGKTQRLHLSDRHSVGVGKAILFSRSHDEVRCGKSTVYWRYPTATIMQSMDKDVRIASTPWTRFEDVKFDDPGLEWVRFEDERKMRFKDF
jgi:hypothetical protein